MLRMRRDPLGLFSEAARECPELARLDLVVFRAYLINSPSLVKQVLQDNRENYPLGSVYEKLRPIFGNSVSMSEGKEWAAQRRLLQPAFAHGRLAGFAGIMAAEATGMARAWREGGAARSGLEMTREMMKLTLSIVVRAMFSSGVKDDLVGRIGDATAVLNEDMNRRFYSLVDIPLFIPTPRNLRFRRALGALEELVYGLIRGRRQDPEPPPDLLSMLLEARYEDTGEGMTERQVRDEIMTIFGAGHETTASVLAWLWFSLSSRPQVEALLHAEVDRVLGGREPGLADIPALPYTRMVIEETMRLYPPAWSFLRTARADDRMGDYRVRAGSLIFLCPYTMHRDARFWADPEVFDPGRFAPERQADLPRFAYFPFGGGPRGCIGQNFAMMEMVLVVAALARRFRFRLAPGHPVELEPLVTLRARHGIRMTLEERA